MDNSEICDSVPSQKENNKINVQAYHDFDLSGFSICWDFEPVGILDLWDFVLQDFVSYPYIQ
ncbi:15205_t:CDS:2 [Funneliformis geosporum]|uniref:15205_t:CDS:1 n=1 Tax=Funneliformis geosporum TaxID=1117311 RepID=A0A9W4SLX2_9GLOM|nr:15205_t:CDS:2 [Funneliformis geosporum]